MQQPPAPSGHLHSHRRLAKPALDEPAACEVGPRKLSFAYTRSFFRQPFCPAISSIAVACAPPGLAVLPPAPQFAASISDGLSFGICWRRRSPNHILRHIVLLCRPPSWPHIAAPRLQHRPLQPPGRRNLLASRWPRCLGKDAPPHPQGVAESKHF